MTSTINGLKSFGQAIIAMAEAMEQIQAGVGEAEQIKTGVKAMDQEPKKRATKKKPEPVQEEAKPVEADTPTESITRESIRKVLREKKAEGKSDKFRELFSQFGVDSFPALPESEFAAFFAAAEAL